MMWLVNRCGARLSPCTWHHNLCHTQIYLFASVRSLMYDTENQYLHTVEEPMTTKGEHHGEESWASRNPPGQ
jgi:hypothetical protein